jgi:hypothetical protein
MKQSDIDNVKEFYSEQLKDTWVTEPDHLTFEELNSIYNLLSFKFWLIRKIFRQLFEPMNIFKA